MLTGLEMERDLIRWLLAVQEVRRGNCGFQFGCALQHFPYIMQLLILTVLSQGHLESHTI
jgi:hypothetical protein